MDLWSVTGYVVLNIFYRMNIIETRRMWDLPAEFGHCVVLHEYRAADREILLRLQTPRRIFVSGKETW